MIQQMMKTEFGELIQLSDISDEDIREYYEAHPEEFHKPEQVRVSHILIKNRAKAQRVLRQVLQNESDTNFFREAAQRNNEDDATRDTFGDLRFLSRAGEEDDGEDVAEAIREAAFSLEQVGQVYPQLVRTEAGFHIIKLTARRAALDRPLDEVRRPIQNKLWRERREKAIEDFVHRLREEAHVEENLELLSEVRVEGPRGLPPAALEHDHGPGGGHVHGPQKTRPLAPRAPTKAPRSRTP
jgi:peptidyl-prolyl cis-trans isomerase C